MRLLNVVNVMYVRTCIHMICLVRMFREEYCRTVQKCEVLQKRNKELEEEFSTVKKECQESQGTYVRTYVHTYVHAYVHTHLCVHVRMPTSIFTLTYTIFILTCHLLHGTCSAYIR